MGNRLDDKLQTNIQKAFAKLSDTTVDVIRVGDYDPSTGVEGAEVPYPSIRALVLGYKAKEIRGTEIKAGDRQVLIAHLDLPTALQTTGFTAKDQIVIDSKRHKVIVPQRDGINDPALWTLQVRA